jgi:2'-5' RNA ligase
MKRTFIAIHVRASQPMMRMINDCRETMQGEKMTWVNPEKMHLTLKFLGDTAEDEIPLIIRELQVSLSEYHAFSVKLKGIGVFRNMHDPRVLWVGMEAYQELSAMRDELEEVLERLGYKKEDKAFSPHLTLARIKYIRRKENLTGLLSRYKEQDLQELPVQEIIYYESILKPEGPEYTVLSKIPLKHTTHSL